MDRKTSDEVAALAGRILAGGNPMDNEQIRASIQKAILETVDCSSPSSIVTVRVPDRTVEEIAIVLRPYFENMLSLAGSAVSQADGD